MPRSTFNYKPIEKDDTEVLDNLQKLVDAGAIVKDYLRALNKLRSSLKTSIMCGALIL